MKHGDLVFFGILIVVVIGLGLSVLYLFNQQQSASNDYATSLISENYKIVENAIIESPSVIIYVNRVEFEAFLSPNCTIYRTYQFGIGLYFWIFNDDMTIGYCYAYGR